MDNYLIEILEKAKRSKAETMDLQNHRLLDFPSMVCQLTHLKTLLVGSYNVVNSSTIRLDEDYWWEVIVDDNQFDFIPESIGLLNNLEVLDLNQVGLLKVPDTIGDLVNLKELKLRNNCLYRLPESFSHLQNLEKLDISFNHFTEIPKVIFECKNLKELNIGANRIKKISGDIKKLQNLEIVDFSNFKACNVSNALVEEFDLNLNSISRLPKSMANLPNLKQVKWDGNPLPIPLKKYLSEFLNTLGFAFWFDNKEGFREIFETDEKTK